eukprot:g19247.t1
MIRTNNMNWSENSRSQMRRAVVYYWDGQNEPKPRAKLQKQLRTLELPQGSTVVQYVDDLLVAGNSALQLPASLAVIKCSAHIGAIDTVSKGNERVDAAAKQAALHPVLLV